MVPDWERDARPAADEEVEAFRALVWEHYREHRRDLPWRRTRVPYEILVSEVMLQQTQVARVVPKHEQFLTLFPSVEALAAAPTPAVLAAWQGLGYNRRALALQSTARLVVAEYGGKIPGDLADLRRLPGVGPATAAAVAVFAYDLPVPFIETNIRSAFLHFFFSDGRDVPDSAIFPLVERTLERDRPRDWYYALMDYGAWLKKHHSNPSRRSRHHTTQSPFAGSRRQLRAAILRAVVAADPVTLTIAELLAAASAYGADPGRLDAALEQLTAEGFLAQSDERYGLAPVPPEPRRGEKR